MGSARTGEPPGLVHQPLQNLLPRRLPLEECGDRLLHFFEVPPPRDRALMLKRILERVLILAEPQGFNFLCSPLLSSRAKALGRSRRDTSSLSLS